MIQEHNHTGMVQNNSQPSVTLKRGVKGEYSWEIKVYDNNLEAAMSKIIQYDLELHNRYGIKSEGA